MGACRKEIQHSDEGRMCGRKELGVKETSCVRNHCTGRWGGEIAVAVGVAFGSTKVCRVKRLIMRSWKELLARTKRWRGGVPSLVM